MTVIKDQDWMDTVNAVTAALEAAGIAWHEGWSTDGEYGMVITRNDITLTLAVGLLDNDEVTP